MTRIGPAARVIGELLRRDLDVRWRGSLFGAGWALMQPLAWMLLYLLLFRTILKIPAPAGAERFGFGIYLLSGLFPYLAFQEGISRSASVWLDNSNLIKKIQINPSYFVVTVCLSAFALELVSLVCLVIYEAALGLLVPSRLPWIVVGLAAQLLLTLVPAFGAAILAAFFRDLIIMVPFLLTALFYLTPVLYPRSLAPESVGWILDLNPMAWVLLPFRAALAGGPAPSVTLVVVVIPVLGALALLLARAADRLRPHLADIL